MAIKLVVAVDNNFGIGYENTLLYRVKEDLKRFKELTTGHFVVMGRKTFESLPSALPSRTNVVVTRNKKYAVNDPCVIIEHDIERLVSLYQGTGQQDKDIWVIGGSEIYEQFLPYADEIHLTLIHKDAEHVDTYFPVEKAKALDFEIVQYDTIFSESENYKVSFITYKKFTKPTKTV